MSTVDKPADKVVDKPIVTLKVNDIFTDVVWKHYTLRPRVIRAHRACFEFILAVGSSFLTVRVGDYVIDDSLLGLFPCSPENFAARYENVN